MWKLPVPEHRQAQLFSGQESVEAYLQFLKLLLFLLCPQLFRQLRLFSFLWLLHRSFLQAKTPVVTKTQEVGETVAS